MQNHQFAILIPLAVGVGAVECTIFVHALAVGTTVNLFRHEKRRGRLGAGALKDLGIIALVISVAFAAHLAEIGLWAVLLVLCDEFQELGTAYYHSAVNYTTLGYGDLLMTPAWVCWGRWRQRTVLFCSAFRPQWSLPLCSGWSWPGLRISETECLRCETSDALPEGRPHWRIFTWARKRCKHRLVARSVCYGTRGRPRHQDARTSILQWLPVTDPLRIAQDPECGYGGDYPPSYWEALF